MASNLVEFNLFGYCNNNPVNFSDPGGYLTLGSIKETIKKIISKLFNKFVEYLNSLIVYKNGKLSIRLSLISTAIESVLFLLGSAAAFLAKKVLFNAVSKILFPNPSKAKTFVSWFIDLWRSTEVARIILWALSVKFKDKARKLQSLLSDFTQNLLGAKSKVLDIAFKICELTSFAGIVAFFIGFFDGNFFDDYFTIALY